MLKQKLKKIIPRAFIYAYWQLINVTRWILLGRPTPIPQVIKQLVIRDFARKNNIEIFIETGTYLGDTVNFLKHDFRKIISIEFDLKLYEQAVTRFNYFDHIKIFHGDSGELLPNFLEFINKPCLFWLDAHYSGDVTGQGKFKTPILDELKAILNHNVKNHVILIDDARDFNGIGDYPTIEDIYKLIEDNNPTLKMIIRKDMIIIK